MRALSSLFILLVSFSSFAVDLDWRDEKLWKTSIQHSLEFFDRTAWDKEGGSYASEISLDGKKKSETRHLIALSRMVYGLAHGGAIERANTSAKFLLDKMVKLNKDGDYFLAAVDNKGEVVGKQDVLVVNQQAYGLNGLVALYQKTGDKELLAKIRSLYASFYERFHDKVGKGFFDGYDLRKKSVVATKSYNSTVYVATSFLLELAEADKEKRAEYVAVAEELAKAVTTHFYDPKTGWIFENFKSDWTPEWRDWQKQGEFSIGVVGHNFQAAWFLMRVAELTADEPTKEASLKVASAILDKMLSKPVFDTERGGVFDSFQREKDKTMWNQNKAWWQQAEAMLALTLAETSGLLKTEKATKARDGVLNFYFAQFVDKKDGGEFDIVDEKGVPTKDTVKGSLGKSTYHTTELARFMMIYAKKK